MVLRVHTEQADAEVEASEPNKTMERRHLYSRRNRRLAAMVCAGFLCAAAAAHTPGAIVGKVVDPNGNPIGGVTVTAEHAVSGVEKHSLTDASGRYSIEPLAPARYILRAEAASYGCIIVPEVIVDDGQRAQQDFRFTDGAAPAGCEPVPPKKAGKKAPKP